MKGRVLTGKGVTQKWHTAHPVPVPQYQLQSDRKRSAYDRWREAESEPVGPGLGEGVGANVGDARMGASVGEAARHIQKAERRSHRKVASRVCGCARARARAERRVSISGESGQLRTRKGMRCLWSPSCVLVISRKNEPSTPSLPLEYP